MQAERRPRRSRQNSASDIDVFSYLVEDIADPSGKSTSWEAERSRISKRASVQDDPDEIETKSVRSRLSDSGVSMNDSGYDSTSPTRYMKPRLGSLPENVLVEDYENLRRQQFEASTRIPQPFPRGQIPISYPYHYEYGPQPPSQQMCLMRDESRHPAISNTRPPLSGYDLLASQLSHGGDTTPPLPAIYRRFTTLNNRLLLQLQDEISEMEAELRRLDDVDAYHRQDMAASRRADWASGRLELLSKIHMKLEHYHASVLSVQKVKSATREAGPEDVETYRAWLAAHRPLQDPEMRFLDDDADLMSLDTMPRPLFALPATETSPLHPYNFHILSSLAGVWLLTCVPSVVSRWTFLFLLACYAIGTQPSTLMSFHLAEAWERTKGIAMPLVFWLIVTMIC